MAQASGPRLALIPAADAPFLAISRATIGGSRARTGGATRMFQRTGATAIDVRWHVWRATFRQTA